MLLPGVSLESIDFIRILEESSDGIVLCDAQGQTLFVNRAAELCMGLPAEALLGKSSEDLAQAGIITQATSSQTIRSGVNFTFLQKYHSGFTAITTSVPIYADGKLSCILINLRNVTALKNLIEFSADANRPPEMGVFHSSAMQQVLVIARSLALVPTTVLLTGESGAGKDVIAKYIHSHSHRASGAFIKINCGALPEHLLESELFGYAPGAFTGANRKGKRGLVEEADNGTLFLDEIAEIPLALQAKLLEFLQDFTFYPLGDTQKHTSRLRVIAATNRDLRERVKNKSFREDLYYRLNVVPLHIPPLRERPDDIMPLIERHILLFNQKYTTAKILDESCRSLFLAYAWPGNVRELVNLCERLVVTVPDTIIRREHLKAVGLAAQSAINLAPTSQASSPFSLRKAMDDLEHSLLLPLVQQKLSSYAIARRLNISQSTAARKLRRHFPHYADAQR